MSDSALPSRSRLLDIVAEHTCTRKCFGVENYSSSCCKLEGRNFIQGPVPDHAAVLERLSRRFMREVTFDEIFVNYEEGRTMFPDKSNWQRESPYPALRPKMDAAAGYPCRFLAADGRCGIYEDRPDMCRNYKCDHLTKVLDLL